MYSSRPKVYWIDGSCLRAKWNDDDRSRGRLANRKSACKRNEKGKGEDSIFIFPSDSLSCNRQSRSAHRCFSTAGDRNFILFAVRPARSLAYVSFVSSSAEVFHEDCGVPGRNLKWMPVSAPRYRHWRFFSSFFPLLFFSPHSHVLPLLTWSPLTEICSRKLLFRDGAFRPRRKFGACRAHVLSFIFFPSYASFSERGYIAA